MAQTREGALKAAAKNAGLTVEEFAARRAAGLKRCTRCKAWKPLAEFNIDRSRPDGHHAACRSCTRVMEPKPVPPPSFKGRSHSPESRRKMSEARKGNSRRLGKPCTPEQRKNISAGTKARTPRGAAHPSWKGGVGALRANRGLTPEDIAWRTAVYERDSYTCQHCGYDKGHTLNAHHIKPWADHPELRHDVSNGITLCQHCHDVEHYGRPRLTSPRARRRLARRA